MEENKKLATKRFVKIGYHLLTITEYSFYIPTKGCVLVPFIRIRGKWLEKIGFKKGQRIQVITSKNLIVIRPEDRNENLNDLLLFYFHSISLIFLHLKLLNKI